MFMLGGQTACLSCSVLSSFLKGPQVHKIALIIIPGSRHTPITGLGRALFHYLFAYLFYLFLIMCSREATTRHLDQNCDNSHTDSCLTCAPLCPLYPTPRRIRVLKEKLRGTVQKKDHGSAHLASQAGGEEIKRQALR